MLGSFDYEKEPVVNTSISVSDSPGLQTIVNLTMEILDVNDAPAVSGFSKCGCGKVYFVLFLCVFSRIY
jgi:hypothetical protein